jgi:hypothetical protein
LPQDEDIPVRKKPRLDLIIKSTGTAPAALTNDVIDLCSDSDDEKPKAKEDSSSVHAIVERLLSVLCLGRNVLLLLPQQQLSLPQRKLHRTLW